MNFPGLQKKQNFKFMKGKLKDKDSSMPSLS